MKLHLDLDCFFAAAHRIDDKSLHNIPIAVGGRSNLSIFDKNKHTRHLSKINGAFTSSILSSNTNKGFEEYFVDNDKRIRGIITTSSYEARAYGVKTAMSVAQALRLCPILKVIPPNYPLYHDLSNSLGKLLQKELPTIEQFSIDEFFADVTGWIDDDCVFEFAVNLQTKIKRELKLPISIGIAHTKWIAKLATNDAKPNGVYIVFKDEVEQYIKNKPISCFPGIGKGYQERLQGHGVSKLADVKEKKELFYSWGKNGKQLYERILGIDNENISVKQDKKSIGLGRTFDPIECRKEIKRRIIILCRHLSFIAHKGGHSPLTYALKIKYQYGLKSKDHTKANRPFSEQYFKEQTVKLFEKIDNHPSHCIVQITITLSNFQESNPTTFDLFNYEKDNKNLKLTQSLQTLRDKFGVDIIKNGSEL